MTTNGSEPVLLRLSQSAEMLGVSIETLRRWESDGRLRAKRSTGEAVGVAKATNVIVEIPMAKESRT